MKISRTPLRISFLGGGTDYPQWYNKKGGAIIGTTINRYCYVMLHNGHSWFTFDLPNKSGLGSSSAYTVGLLRVCTELDKQTIATLATTWEQDKMNGAVGSQDQYLCSVGGFHHLKFSEHGVRGISISSECTDLLQNYLMLFDTHQYRQNKDVIPQQLDRMKENEQSLIRLTEMVDEGIVLLKKKDYIGFGKLVAEDWELKSKFSDSVTTPLIDEIYNKAIDAGAVGGKLLGGGGGGFMLFVVEPDKQESVNKALSEQTHCPFEFETEGTRVIYSD